MSENWKVQVSLRWGDTLVNLRGDTVEEVVEALQATSALALGAKIVEALSGVPQASTIQTPVAVPQAPAATGGEKVVTQPNASATQKQLELLAKLGVPVEGDLTRQQASQLIEARLAALKR